MKIKKRGVAWGILIALLCSGAWIDSRLVRQESGTAYVPEDADCLVVVDDFPALCNELNGTEAAKSLEDALRMPLYELVVGLRNTTGIRPTSWRWRLWLGPRLAVAHNSGGWGGCARPGVLMRIVTSFQRTPADGIFSWNSLFYRWRDGFMIFGPSRDFVAKSLAAPPRALDAANAPAEIRATFKQGDLQAFLSVQPEKGFQISGWIQPPHGVLSASKEHTASLSLVNTWPESPLLAITSARWEDLRLVTDLRFLLLRYIDPYKASMWYQGEKFLADQWGIAQLPKNWSLSTQEFGLALFDTGLDGVLPVPELALVLRQAAAGRPNPLEPLAHTGTVLPYEWEGKRGQIVPYLGERWALCLARDDKDWFATSNQLLMGKGLGKLSAGPPIQADLMLQLDWMKLGECMTRILNAAAEEELLMWKDVSDLGRDWMPYVDGMKKLGTLELRAIRESDRVRFEGHLTQSGKEVR